MPDRDALVQRLNEIADTVAEHAQASDDELDRTYRRGGWTARQILAHLGDTAIGNLFRFYRAVAEEGASVELFDEDAWAEGMAYGRRPGELSADVFVSTHRLLAHLVATLPTERLDGTCDHPEKGLVDGWRWAELMADHAFHHLTQIAAARAGIPWEAPAPGPLTWQYLGGPPPADA